MDIRSYILSKFPNKQPNSDGKLHINCPFHADRHPSFSVNVDKGLFICGSPKCGVRGNFMLLYKMLEGIENWKEVYERLKSSRIEVDINKLLGIQEQIESQQRVNQWPSSVFLAPIQSCEYLTSRGLGQGVIEQFGLQFGVGGSCDGVPLRDTLVAPIYELDGIYKTFQVRYVNPLSKMRWKFPNNSPNSDILYGGWLINSRTPDLWVVEGASDVWRMSTFGVQSVGLFTKEASSQQYNKIYYLCTLYGLRPIVCLDGDVVVGKKFKKDYVIKLFSELQAFGLDPQVVRLELEEDPGSLTAERFQQIQQQLGGNECKR